MTKLKKLHISLQKSFLGPVKSRLFRNEHLINVIDTLRAGCHLDRIKLKLRDLMLKNVKLFIGFLTRFRALLCHTYNIIERQKSILAIGNP